MELPAAAQQLDFQVGVHGLADLGKGEGDPAKPNVQDLGTFWGGNGGLCFLGVK